MNAGNWLDDRPNDRPDDRSQSMKLVITSRVSKDRDRCHVWSRGKG